MNRTSLAVVTVLLLLPSVAVAQTDGPLRALPQGSRVSDSLPRELVEALLGLLSPDGGNGPLVRVREPGEGIPPGLLGDAQILGSANTGVGAVTVAYMPYSRAAVLDTLRRRLVSAGFRPPPAPFEARGFASPFPAGQSNLFCRDRDALQPLVRIRSLNRSLLILLYQRYPGAIRCDDQPHRSIPRQLSETPLPVLLPPPGMQSLGGGSSGGSDEWSLNSRLTGDTPVAEVFRHYLDAFTTAGWNRTEETAGQAVAAATLRFESADGTKWFCAFTASRVPDSALTYVALQLRRMNP